MRKSIATNLVIPATVTQYSEAIPTEGQNGVSLDLTVMSWYSAGTMTFTANVQESVNMQTWTDVNSGGLAVALAGTASGFPTYTSVSTTASSTLTGKYVRVKYIAQTAGQLCVSTGINFFSFAT